MKNVTDRTSNPFGMRPPFERHGDGQVPAVFGYGDANADFHVVGDHPGVHGGATTGVPFTETESGVAVQGVLRELGFASGPFDEPSPENCFLSYLHLPTLADDRSPTQAEYDELERFFDAELRAINPHVIVPVGERATDHVLREYTTRRHRFGNGHDSVDEIRPGGADLDMAELHAEEIRGRGFMVVPMRDPAEWAEGDREAIVSKLESVLASDYRQTKGVATTVG